MNYQERKHKAVSVLIPTLRQLARIYDINPATIAEKAGQKIEDAEAPYQEHCHDSKMVEVGQE